MNKRSIGTFWDMPTSEFAEFATSWAGCRGGSLSAKYWFCGIEYGTGGKPSKKDGPDSFQINPKLHLKPIDDARTELAYPYGIKLTKLLFSIDGLWSPSDSKLYKKLTMEREPFAADGTSCRFNLYPIPFRTASDSRWTTDMADEIGLPTKEIYRAWCQLFRFPKFHEELLARIRENRGPRAIICTGTQLATDYVHAFGGIDHLRSNLDKKRTHEIAEKIQLHEVKLDGSNVHLFVTPFLGRSLNSNEKIHSVGRAIAHLIEKHTIESGIANVLS